MNKHQNNSNLRSLRSQLTSLAIGLCFSGFCLGLIVLSAGCKKTTTVDQPNEKTAQAVSFLVSCDTNGWIVPCGCTTKQSGGLLRRGTLVAKMKSSSPTVVLDAGGAAAGKSDYHQVKLESILKGELAMGIDAHNIGASEAAFGADVIRSITSDLNAPIISANACDAGGQLIADPMKIIERGGQTFAVIGVLDPGFASGDLQVKDPRQAILDLLDQLETPVDGKIVLAYLPREPLIELAKQLPEIDVVIGGPTGQTIAPTQVGATLVTSATNKGKFVAKLQSDPAASKRWSAKIVEVDETHADDSRQIENLADYHQVLQQADFVAAQTGLSDRAMVRSDNENHYAGNQSCKQCHDQDCAHYSSTKHAVAWETLEVKHSHVDPYCQQCHTTGYAANGGFESIAKSPQLFDVGCESCHGPSSRHVAEVKTRTPFVAKDQCIGCHDRENSPAFDYQPYWEKIIHGAKVAMVNAKGDATAAEVKEK